MGSALHSLSSAAYIDPPQLLSELSEQYDDEQTIRWQRWQRWLGDWVLSIVDEREEGGPF